MLRVGLTGGIGSGKSTVARIFAALGIPVYCADTASKQILARPTVRAQALLHFPEIAADPHYDASSFISFTQALGRVVFPAPEKLAILNALLHPLVFADCDAWFERLTQGEAPACDTPASMQGADAGLTVPYAIVEAAILLECGLYKRMDKIIDVTCPETVQIRRACRRDGTTEDAVRARIARQWPAERRRPYADFVIENDDRQSVLAAVLEIDRQLRA